MSDAAALMDRMYRRQRYIYDLSRKFYLLGRDEAISRLRPAPGDKVLEIGCGTGRNLVKLAQTYPEARLFGLGGRHGARPARNIRLRKFRARDDLIRLVDDPALARSARPSA
jgi:SAM-dependent methyltransferase